MDLHRGLAFAAVALALTLSPARASEPEAMTADGLVQKMLGVLNGTAAFTLHVEKLYDVVLISGPKVQHSGAMDIAVRRPDRIYVSYGDDFQAKEIWYDGAALTIQDHDTGVHGAVPAADTIDATVDLLAEKYGLFLPLAELFSSDSLAKYAELAGDKYYIGLSDVNGTPAHHVLFTGPYANWQVWIDAGETPLPLKIVIDEWARFGEPQQTIFLSEWDLAPELSDEVFEPLIVEGSVRAEFIPLSGGN